jgi:predicted secreted protein
MSLYSGILVFIVIWWLVLFAVLPWGVRRSETSEPGHAVEAPANPHLPLKFAVTTLIALVLFAAAWWLVQSDLISFREP